MHEVESTVAVVVFKLPSNIKNAGINYNKSVFSTDERVNFRKLLISRGHSRLFLF